jgi:hypothetical protein
MFRCQYGTPLNFSPSLPHPKDICTLNTKQVPGHRVHPALKSTLLPSMHDPGTGHVASNIGPVMDGPFPNNSKSTPVPSSRRKPSRTRTSDRDASDEFFSTPASQAMPMAGNPVFDPYPAAQPLAKHPSRRMTSGSSERCKKSKLEVLNDPLLHQTFLYQPRGLAQELFASHLVGYAEYGIPDGHPVIVIGGLGCSRLVGVMFHEISKRHKIRMLIPERMGYGLTEACNATDMTVLQWAGKVSNLLFVLVGILY